VIAEYERVGLVPDDAAQDPMTTAPDAAR